MKARLLWIVLAIAGLLAWVFLDREPTVRTNLSVPMTSNEGPPRIELLEDAQGAAGSLHARSEVRSGDSSDLARFIPLQVIDRENGRPVAGAEVFACEMPLHDDASYLLQRGERGALGDWLVEHGRPTLTDERGEARLPRAIESSSVFARRDGRWALESYGEADERVVLELGVERTLEVHVTSHEGADAAGIDVVLRSIDMWGMQFHSATDEHGLARFRHLRPFLRDDVAEPCEITLLGLFSHRPALGFDALMQLPPRVELALPACGSLDVELVGESGAPVETKSDFAFNLPDVNDDLLSACAGVQRSSPDGHTRADFVEIGLDVDVYAGTAGSRSAARALAHGPSHAGEVVSVRVQLVPPPAARLRAVDESGRVLAGHMLRFIVRDTQWDDDNSDPWPAQQLITDDGGHFHLPFGGGMASFMFEDEFRRTVDVSTKRRDDGSELHYRTEFTGTLPKADVESGDAIFTSARRIVAGRVVDEVGGPVAGAQVRVYLPEEEPQDRDRANEASRQLAWTVSDEHGDFEAVGSLGADIDRIRVLADLGRPSESPSIVVAIGAHDVVLVVSRTGTIEGSLLLPDGVLGQDVRLEWVGNGAGAGESMTRSESAEEGAEPHLARFRFYTVRAGTGSLNVRVGSNLIASFDDVVVIPVEPTRDPRLQRIDLRGRLRLLRVWVDAPDGTPARGGTVRPTPSIHAKAWSHQDDRSIVRGVATCVVPLGPLDVWVGSSGARHETILGVTQDELRVRLRPPYEVQLEFRAPNLPTGLLTWVDTPDRDRIPCLESMPIPGGARFSLSPSATGSFQVSLVLPMNAGIRAERNLGSWPITVADTDLPQIFVLDVDPKLLEAALH